MYGLLIVYGSLYPFVGWQPASFGPAAFLFAGWPSRFSKPDALTNVLAYLPFGLLVARGLHRVLPLGTSVVAATALGAALSFGIEFLQQFLPARVASVADLATNTGGTVVGAILGVVLRANRLAQRRFEGIRNRWLSNHHAANVGAFSIVLWALSQVTPLVPSIDVGNLRRGVAPLRAFVLDPASFNLAQWATYTLDIAGLAIIARMLVRPNYAIGLAFFALVASVLLYKIPAVSRQLSMESILGALAAGAVALPFFAARTSLRAWVGATLIIGGFAVGELSSTGRGALQDFVWVPFRAQMGNPLIGIASITENLWPPMALAYLAMRLSRDSNRREWAWLGGIGLTSLAFALEWRQQLLPGRVGDVTTVLLILGTWMVAWILSPRVIPEPDPSDADTKRSTAESPAHSPAERRRETARNAMR